MFTPIVNCPLIVACSAMQPRARARVSFFWGIWRGFYTPLYLDTRRRLCYNLRMISAEIIASTTLPTGYERYELYLRRYLLDLRLHLRSIPKERENLLKRWMYESLTHDKRAKRQYVSGTASALAESVR
jgi:hypothetical protein